MDLSKLTKEQLEQELESRAKRENRPQLRPINYLVNDLDAFSKCFDEWYVQCLVDSGSGPKDAEHFSYERVIEFLYGKEFWDWFNGLRF